MKVIKESKNKATNGNGSRAAETTPVNQKELKSYKSAMKAFEMTHKRLYPELHKAKEKAKRG